MAKVIETRISYSRKIGMADYGSISWSGEEQIELEEGDDAAQVRTEHYAILRAEAKAALEPIVKEHKEQAKTFGKQPGRLPSHGKRATAPLVQGELPSGSELPKVTTVVNKAAGPVQVDKSGQRIRNIEERSFTVEDIDRAVVALVPDGNKMDNPLRADVRKWLLAGPLNPSFSDDDLALAESQYHAYRTEGDTTTEAMRRLLGIWMEMEAKRPLADAGSSKETDDPATSEPGFEPG